MSDNTLVAVVIVSFCLAVIAGIFVTDSAWPLLGLMLLPTIKRGVGS